MTDEFISRCLSDAADLGLFLAGQPQEDAMLALHGKRESMANELVAEFGSDAALLIAEAFVTTVLRCKAAIEEASVAMKETVQ